MSSYKIILTYHAFLKINELKKEFPDYRLYIAVQEGGCKDYYYDINFLLQNNISSVAIMDIVVQNNIEDIPITITVHSPIEYQPFLDGCILDYRQSLMQESFEVIYNPRAQKLCKCGVSFKI